MFWDKKFYYLPQYKWTSSNQHGNRYKKHKTKAISIARLSCETNDVNGVQILILLSHTLDMPVRYDFDHKPQQAYIEVVSTEKLRKNE